MPIAKTYTVGDAGGVRRLDNLSGSWIDVSVSSFLPAVTGALRDVETDPNNGNKVFTVGGGTFVNSVYGIYVSTDAGASWYVPGGNYNLNMNAGGNYTWLEVFVLDSNNIFVAGINGYIAVSNDGGLTFNLSTQIPLLTDCVTCTPYISHLYSVHFVTPLIGVVGAKEHVLITYDGGLTWNVLNGGNPLIGTNGTAQEIVGIHISSDLQTIVACGKNNMFQSTDAGNTFTDVFYWKGDGRHLTWINDNELWGFGAKNLIIKTIDGGATWSIVAPYSPTGPTHLAGHFYQNQNGFYSNNSSILFTNNGASSGVLSETSPYGVTAVWTWFRNPVCYILTDCSGILSPILLNWDALEPYVGQVIQIPSLYPNTCWIVSISPTCEGANLVRDTEIISFDDCLSCNPPQCFGLTECTGSIPYIITNDVSLIGFEDEVVEICITEGDVTNCYCFTITGLGPCLEGNPLPDNWEIIGCVEDCNSCLPPLPPPFELHPRRIKPGYYTPNCPPEYTEKVSCKFADQMYEEMIAKRYGITICCDHDPDTWIIRKQILDLKAIYDPDLCKCFLQQCCPPTCIDSDIQVFNPADCLAPTLSFVNLVIVCVCYQVSSELSRNCQVEYVDCDGLPSSIIVPPESTVSICSQIYPYSNTCTPVIVQVGECLNGSCP